MISVLIKIPAPSRYNENKKMREVYEWMGTHVVDHWSVSVLTIDTAKVDFFGLDQEQDIIAFKLKFGGV